MNEQQKEELKILVVEYVSTLPDGDLDNEECFNTPMGFAIGELSDFLKWMGIPSPKEFEDYYQ